MGATFMEDLGDGSNRDDDEAASAWTGDSTTTTTPTPPPSWCELDTDRHATSGREGRGVRRSYRNLGLWLAVVSTVANIVVVCVVYAYSL
ncbi:unnamed protein product [Lampetra planeri]